MDPIIILQAGVATGTILLFATIGEIFAERSGVMNLGVEGMMLIGAMTAFSTAIATGNPWLGFWLPCWPLVCSARSTRSSASPFRVTRW